MVHEGSHSPWNLDLGFTGHTSRPSWYQQSRHFSAGPCLLPPSPGENHSISPVASLAGLSDILAFLSSIVITLASKSTNQPDGTNLFFPMGPWEHLPFPVPCKNSQPNTKDWVFAIYRFYWSKSVLGGRPCIGSVFPRRLGQGEWVGGGPFSGQQLCLCPDMTSSNRHLPLEHCRRSQDGSQLVMGTVDEKGRKTSKWLNSETAKAPPWGGRLCATRKRVKFTL